MQVKIVFYKAKYGGYADKLIAWWTSSLGNKLNGKWKESYSHVEVLFSDGMMFSASYRDNALRFARHREYSSRWERKALCINTQEESAIRIRCESLVGTEYDYRGVFSFVVDIGDSGQRFFCSEVVAMVLKPYGYFKGMDASRLSPNDLARELLVLK